MPAMAGKPAKMRLKGKIDVGTVFGECSGLMAIENGNRSIARHCKPTG
jgi:hypothetical protein